MKLAVKSQRQLSCDQIRQKSVRLREEFRSGLQQERYSRDDLFAGKDKRPFEVPFDKSNKALCQRGGQELQ